MRVPQFIFTASCRHHDFNYERGCGATHWYENLWLGPWYKLKADYDFFQHMFADAMVSRFPAFYGAVSCVYFLAVVLNPIAWCVFTYGRWRTTEEILLADHNAKMRL